MPQERKPSSSSLQTGPLFDQPHVRNIYKKLLWSVGTTTAAFDRRPVPSMQNSYLIVRLEMQYFHITFHAALTSPEASGMPEKTHTHGATGKT